MATNVADTSHESYPEKVPLSSEDDRKIETDTVTSSSESGNNWQSLPPEVYKNKHQIGVRLSTENSLSAINDSSLNSPLSSPIKDPFSSPSPSDGSASENDTTPLSTPTEDKESTFRVKTLDDSGIDVDIAVLHKKQPIVHLGDRIAVSPDGKVYNVPDKEKSKVKLQKEKTMKKTLENNCTPCRRIQREASLNAAARVNILFEKDVPVPKVPRKISTSSTGSTCIGDEKTKKPMSKSSSVKKKDKLNDSDKNEKSSDKWEKSPEKKTKKLKCDKIKVKEVLKRNKSKNESKFSKSKGGNKMKLKGRMTSAPSKYKYYPAKLLAKRKNLTKVKPKVKDKGQATRKRKSSEKEQSKSKVKKVKIDTLRAARTHFISEKKVNINSNTERKVNYNSTGIQCVGCYRQALCTPTGTVCWSNSDFTDGPKEGECISEEKTCQTSTTSFVPPPPPPRVQLMDTGSTYMNTVVPHQTIPACPQCAQRGLIPTPPCQSYTLGGIGSISSVQVMSYPQPFGGTYPAMPYQTNHSTLPHCGLPGCASCYSTTAGIYYPQTASPMSHAPPLAHDPCHITAQPPIPTAPSVSIHSLSEKDESKSETEIIDVGERELLDIKPILLTPPKTEKDRKTSTSSNASNKIILSSKEKKSSEKKIKLKISETKKAVNRQKSKDGKKLKDLKDKSPKKPKYNKSLSKHGWEFEGDPEKKKISSLSLGSSFETNCYQSIRHIDGDVIAVRECVMLRSGPKKTDIPYVAKVTNFWENPHDGEMMMSLLWYYQPEHTEGGRKPHHAPCELFASKHRDENSVACIDDKGYVLTFAEFCRYRAELRRQECHVPPRPSVIPSPDEEYPRSSRLPEPGVDPNQVYLCRQVYDFKLKRILKNPS